MTPRLLVVGCGFPQLGLLRFARAEGLHVIGADANRRAVGVAACDEYVEASTADASALVRAARDLRAAAITTCGSELALGPVAVAARELGLPFYATPELLASIRHKHDMRALYAAGGAPSPAHRAARSLEEVREFAREHGLPLVVKPSRGWGQRGVRVVHDDAELVAAATAALEAARDASGNAPEEREAPVCVVEEFVEGSEYSVDAYTVEGVTEVLAVTERIITGYPDPPGITFAEVYPSGLEEPALRAVEDAARKGARALGIRRGPTYTQVRFGPRGAYLVETAHRLGGGLDPDVTLLASGVSLYRRIVGFALGRTDWERAGVEAPRHGGATGRFLVARPGRVRGVAGLEEARRQPGVVDAQVYVEPGKVVGALTDGSQRAGHVLAAGGSREEAESNARRAMDLIEIETEPAGSGAAMEQAR